jgi:ribonuclease HII
MSPKKSLETASPLPPVNWKILGPGPLFGVDEVGRGCLAGPVVAGAACLLSDELVDEMTDSKLLSEKQREDLAPRIQEKHLVGIGFASVEEIDEINILQASLLAMKRAVHELEKQMKRKAGHLLIDGTFKIPGLRTKQTTYVQGDLRVAPISAAAIVAKVYRDRWMKEIGKEHPHYGFEEHKGYASPKHRRAIADHGPCLWHRKTFSGVREYLPEDIRPDLPQIEIPLES